MGNMASISFLSKLKTWILSTELFERPSKLIVGKWQLYEYFIDDAEELQHITSDQLKKENSMLVISVLEDHNYIIASSLPVPLIQKIVDGKWRTARNFVTFQHPEEFRNNVEFQFAFEKGNLKLLKKDSFGNIEFFGFFNRVK